MRSHPMTLRRLMIEIAGIGSTLALLVAADRESRAAGCRTPSLLGGAAVLAFWTGYVMIRFLGRHMLVIALAGLIVGAGLRGVSLLWLSVRYRAIAEMHSELAASEPITRGHYSGPGGADLCVEWSSPKREYHLGMQRKYVQAIARPWHPLEPDPPPPERAE